MARFIRLHAFAPLAPAVVGTAILDRRTYPRPPVNCEVDSKIVAGIAAGGALGAWLFLWRGRDGRRPIDWLEEFSISHDSNYARMSMDGARAWQKARERLSNTAIGEMIDQDFQEKLKAFSEKNCGADQYCAAELWNRREILDFYLVDTWNDLCKVCGHEKRAPMPAHVLTKGLQIAMEKKVKEQAVLGVPFEQLVKFMAHKKAWFDAVAEDTSVSCAKAGDEFRFFDLTCLLVVYLELGWVRGSQKKKRGSGEEVLAIVYDLMDRNGDGKVDEQEFLESMCILDYTNLVKVRTSNFLGGVDYSKVKRLFSRADADKSQTLSYEEFRSFCGEELVNVVNKANKLNNK